MAPPTGTNFTPTRNRPHPVFFHTVLERIPEFSSRYRWRWTFFIHKNELSQLVNLTGRRDEPPSAGGGNCILMQFTVPADRAERSPKGVGSIPVVRAAARREQWGSIIPPPRSRRARGANMYNVMIGRIVLSLLQASSKHHEMVQYFFEGAGA